MLLFCSFLSENFQVDCCSINLLDLLQTWKHCKFVIVCFAPCFYVATYACTSVKTCWNQNMYIYIGNQVNKLTNIILECELFCIIIITT